MPYVYREVEALKDHELVGNAQCVALVFQGTVRNGKWVDASNNGDAFSVIE